MLNKALSVTLFWIVFSSACFGQAKSTLTGTVYDALGSVISLAKVTATDEKGNKVDTFTNDSGVYKLEIPFCQYLPATKCKMAKYEIRAQANGFKDTVIKDYLFVEAYPKKMSLDIALHIAVFLN